MKTQFIKYIIIIANNSCNFHFPLLRLNTGYNTSCYRFNITKTLKISDHDFVL